MSERKTLDYGRVGMPMSDIRSLVVETYFGGIARHRRPRPVFCWGAPGEGKTFTILAAARDVGEKTGHCSVIEIPTSCLEPCDISGVPFPIKIDGVETYSRYLGPDWAWFISKEYEEWEQKRRGDSTWRAPAMFAFFDDLVAAHFQTQSSFFKGVHQGIWGALHQRDNVMVVGAGNRMEDNAGANDMPTALGNRFRHCYAAPTPQDWLEWAAGYRDKGEPGVPGEERIHPLVRAYIRMCNDDLREFDESVATRSEKAFASARTWEDVSELLYEGRIKPDNRIFGKTVMGIVGMGIGTRFLAFMRNSTRAVPPDVIVRDPMKAPVPGRKDIDALHATVTSLEAYIKANPDSWRAAIQYALREEMVADVGICLAQTAMVVVSTRLSPKDRAKANCDPVMGQLHERYEDLFDVIHRLDKAKD